MRTEGKVKGSLLRDDQGCSRVVGTRPLSFSVFLTVAQSVLRRSRHSLHNDNGKDGAARKEQGRGLGGGDPSAASAGAHAQAVQVNDSMLGFIGADVVLHCSFANPLPGVKITQVTWQKASNGSKQNMAIYNPAMGFSVLPPYNDRVEFLRPSFMDGTIRLSRLQLEDEGVYICEFATFPAGNRESQLNLTVMGKLAQPPPGAWPSPRRVHGPDMLLLATPKPRGWHFSPARQAAPHSTGDRSGASAEDRAEDPCSGCGPHGASCGWPGGMRGIGHTCGKGPHEPWP